MVENYLAREIELLEEIEALNKKVDSIISKVKANEDKIAQHDVLHCKHAILWAQLRARKSIRKSSLFKEVDSSSQNDQLDQFGLIPLSEVCIQQIKASSSSCVRFIGSLVQASFPDGYFENHLPYHVTKLQLKRLYEMTSAHFTEIKRARRNPVKLTFREVVNVIRTYIYNAHSRGRKRISSSSSTELTEFCNDIPSTDRASSDYSFSNVDDISQDSSGSVFKDDGFIDNDTDGDCCDKPCDPPNHYADCKNFTGLVHLDGKYQWYEGTEWAKLCHSKLTQCPKFDISPVKSGSVRAVRNPLKSKNKVGETKSSQSARVHRCHICDKCFVTEQGMIRHKLIHTDPQHWKKCSICDHRATNISNLRKHISRKHGKNSENRHKCNICLKVLATSKNLDRHRWIVHQK